MRINKYIASSGLASRRKADELIQEGKVKVNRVVLKEPGYDVKEGDIVEVNGKIIEPETNKVYFALNKPLNCVTTVSDDRSRLTVVDYMEGVEESVFPVGRLDYNTTGLIFMTNDGDFAYKVMHPKNKVGKVYRVVIAGHITKPALAKLRYGVDIGGFVTSRARVDIITWNKRSTLLEIEIHEGKNRQIRRMFKAVGYNVEELERISIGNIQLGHLKPGHYRKLNPSEINYLMNL